MKLLPENEPYLQIDDKISKVVQNCFIVHGLPVRYIDMNYNLL